MTGEEIARLRDEYESAGLSETDMADAPMEQFETWFEAVAATGIHEPNAFVLATTDEDGAPSGRAVLMKEFGADGIVFYTGMDSRKSRALRATGRAAGTFVWIPIHRQVRFEGGVEEIAAAAADAYFATRPRGAQIAAHASHQSELVSGREALDDAFSRIAEEYGSDPIPRPEHWGGWRLRPTSVEFWQGQRNRFHDRVRYRLADGDWIKERLAP